ncbi:Rv3654c family TadE-like protein [Mycolicibacter minnesotensis]
MAAVAMVAVLLTVTGGGFLLGAAVVARHRAQAAADLAALAGAARVPGGSLGACAQASALTRRMLTGEVVCVVDDLDVIVTVAVPVPGWRLGRAQATARAGPVAQPPR